MGYIIKNVKVYDGLGGKPFMADVVIEGDKITKVCENAEYNATIGDVIDGTGYCLAPGFIDAHTHSDQQCFKDPSRAGRLLQGITSEIGGQCGSSKAPFLKSMPEDAQKFVNVAYKNPIWFETFKEELEAVENLSLGANQKYFVGHRLVRCSVMGIEGRAATDAEIDKMCGLVEEAMESGALGFSTGLVYAPGPFAETKEIVALAKVAGKHGGIYTSHIRNESDFVEEAIKEVIDIGRKAEVPVNISHIKCMYPDNWGKVESVLETIDKALDEGIDVTMDAYPYEACSAGILSTVPPSYRAKGVDWMISHMEGKANRDILKDIVLGGKEKYENPMKGIGPEKLLIVSAPKTPDAEGKFISEYANEHGIDGFDAWCDIIVQNGGSVTDVRFAMRDEDIEKFYKHRKCMVGSDGLYSGGTGLCHPRYFGTMTRYLGRFVRERKILPFEEGIRRITSMPAERYGLKNKGVVKEGYDADLVLFDENTIIDHAEYLDPYKANEGIRAVFVNGGLAVIDNIYTGLTNGRLYRR